jgi:hypothetical protein
MAKATSMALGGGSSTPKGQTDFKFFFFIFFGPWRWLDHPQGPSATPSLSTGVANHPICFKMFLLIYYYYFHFDLFFKYK